MGIFDNIYLTDKEKIKRNISLSDVLSIYDIAELWSDDKREKGIYMEAMYNGFKQTDLKGQECKKDNGGMVIISPYTIYQEIKVNKKDFKLWLESNKEVLPEDCLLINWWNVDFKEKKQKATISKDANIKELERTISEKIGLNVIIKNNKRNKGTITFSYKEIDQLNKIIEILKFNY